MDEQRQDGQLELTYNGSVPIQDVAMKTNRKRWTIETGGLKGPGDPRRWRNTMIIMTV